MFGLFANLLISEKNTQKMLFDKMKNNFFALLIVCRLFTGPSFAVFLTVFDY